MPGKAKVSPWQKWHCIEDLEDNVPNIGDLTSVGRALVF